MMMSMMTSLKRHKSAGDAAEMPKEILAGKSGPQLKRTKSQSLQELAREMKDSSMNKMQILRLLSGIENKRNEEDM